MIKEFAQYKNPYKGDYVICQSRSYIPNTPLAIWLRTNIGQVVGWYDAYVPSGLSGLYDNRRVVVKFENLPKEFAHVNNSVINSITKNSDDPDNSRAFPLELIEYCSPNKEDCETYIETKKYNL